MDLYLQRHGRAFYHNPERFPDDDLRPLTADGEQRLEAVAQGMSHMKLERSEEHTSDSSHSDRSRMPSSA